MHKFSDFAADDEHLEGDKVSFKELIGKPIIIWNALQMLAVSVGLLLYVTVLL